MYAKPTLATLKQSLADRKESGEIPTDAATLSQWIRMFNRAVNYCINKLGIEKSVSLTTVSGTIALPDDFTNVNRVENSEGNELAVISQEDATNASGLVYWVTGDFVSGFSLNTLTDETFTVFYAYKVSPMAVDADVCPFPDEEAIVAYTYGMLRKSESDPFEDADRSIAECDLRLNEITHQYGLNEPVQQFKLDKNA